jgi:hypothetical protein
MSTSIFEKAARARYRFPTNRGELTVEQVFDLPLQSKSGFDLDTVARDIYNAIKATSEVSFVGETSPANAELETKLEIVKHVIKTKRDEAEARRLSAARKTEADKLAEILARKKDSALDSLSIEEIEARLNELKA